MNFSLQDKPGYNRIKAVQLNYNARTNLVYRTSLATIELRLRTAERVQEKRQRIWVKFYSTKERDTQSILIKLQWKNGQAWLQ